ncbi:hypothetical protein ENUP19_0054G0102 [Entamoeba nuttalli]|uniref:Uncharacterized protein n=2 Tax=Entamoeba nuttalli TaxID=412467 RepID=K2G606_ENTNP|nr:hypothetical protein ENU1_184870 [Entamoeba nuttalli P19]EKE37831.1 hypothetical protein ENU1_184870 [Entamoeba nuttalli P19]|eukprot:XP_008859837.1 hypothetical protein ENU1_184870 [Entamoeba nuttalli P19]
MTNSLTPHYKAALKMKIQVSYFEKLMQECIINELLPISTLWKWNEIVRKRQILEFYGTGYLKERITLKIISSFEVCNLNFLTKLRGCILKKRGEVFDLLKLNDYLTYKKDDNQKESFMIVFLGECGLRKNLNSLNFEMKRLIQEIEYFVINFLFVKGCNDYFDSPLKILVLTPYRRNYYFKKKAKPPHIDSINISSLFDLSTEI